MILTIATTHRPATDLGYLLHKHPERCQTFPMEFGKAHVFYPEANEVRCAVALLLDVDSVGLVSGKLARQYQKKTVDQPVNDRPYIASSFLSVAILKVFSTALAGRCNSHPNLADTAIPLEVSISVLPCSGGEAFLRSLFYPLGYDITTRAIPLDSTFPDWKDSHYFNVTLRHTIRLSDLLSHLCVLIPVLDDDKHHWFSEDKIDRLLRRGESWLKTHPAQAHINRRYLKHKRKLAETALARLMEGEDPDAAAEAAAAGWQKLAALKPVSLNQQRMEQVAATLKAAGAKRIVDLGCGEGSLLWVLRQDQWFEKLMGVDVSYRELAKAKKRLRRELSPMQQRSSKPNSSGPNSSGPNGPVQNRSEPNGSKPNGSKSNRSEPNRVELMQGSLIYRDERLKGYDAATVIEVIEHMDLDRLAAFERVLFEFAQPGLVIVTTPNAEFNVHFSSLQPGKLRHQDHRFEWTRQEFWHWAKGVCDRFGYSVTFQGIGFDDPAVGSPTQMALFQQKDDASDTPRELPKGQVYQQPLKSLDVNSAIADDMLDITDVLDKRRISTRLYKKITIREESAIAALEVISRFAVNPKWLIYLPPTLSPVATSKQPHLLEHPTEAFDYYQQQGIKTVICEEKHMGSRVVVIVCRDESAAKQRFGVENEGMGICYTRTGRRFFADQTTETALIARVNQALCAANFWDTFQTDWVCLDCELMPWSAKAKGLLKQQYAPVGAAAKAGLGAAVTNLQKAITRAKVSIETGSTETGSIEAASEKMATLLAQFQQKKKLAEKYTEAYRRCCWPVEGLNGLKLAPFHILATEGKVHIDKTHAWHMQQITKITKADPKLLLATRCKAIDITDETSRAEGLNWWESLTAAGGEGMVVKSMDFVHQTKSGPLQPAVKCRGAEHLRLIYGPDYTLPENLERLKQRGLSRKRSLARREFSLGIESLERFINKAPLRQVHECVFGILALESEPVDLRL